MIADCGTLAAARQRSQAVAREWQRSPAYRRLAGAFGQTSDSDDPEVLAAAAESLLADDGLVAELLLPLAEALRSDPWFEPPFRFTRDGLRSAAVLFASPAASLVATVLSADTLAALPPPPSVALSGRVSVTRYVVAGGAHLRRWRAPLADEGFSAAEAPPAVPLSPLALHDGLVLRQDGRSDGHVIAGAARDMAMVTVTIQRGAAPFAREYAIPGGQLLRVAMVDEAAARTQMLLTLLRLSGRGDAAPVFADATEHPAFFLRWSAMREWLALDTPAAAPRLRTMAARDPHHEVRGAARMTLAQVEERLACHA